VRKFPFIQQPDQKDCGPVCLKMIYKYYGISVSLERLRVLCVPFWVGSPLYIFYCTVKEWN